MPRYVARNYLNELLQSLQSAVGCLLILEDIPRVELAAHEAVQQSLVSTFISSHPWLQDKIDFNGLNFTEIQISEEVQHLSMNRHTSTISDLFEREAEWCLLRSSYSASCTRGCCKSVAQQPQEANDPFNWMDSAEDVKKNANDDDVIIRLTLEDVLLESHASRGRRLSPPLASLLVRRLKPSVVSDPFFDQTTSSETMIFKNEFASVNPLLKEMHTSDDCCSGPYVEDEADLSGIDAQKLVLEEPMTLHGSTIPPFDNSPWRLLLSLEPISSSQVEAVHREELINCAAEVETEELSGTVTLVVAPIEAMSQPTTIYADDQLSFISMNQFLGNDAVKREPFLLLESPLLRSSTTDPRCHAFPCLSYFSLEEVVEEVEEEEETMEQLLMLCEQPSDLRFQLNKVSEVEEVEMSGSSLLWQNEKYFDEIQLLALRECRLQSVTTCDDSLRPTSVWSAVDTLSLTSEEITTSQELEMSWDPLQASYSLMVATERHSMEPVMMAATERHSMEPVMMAATERHRMEPAMLYNCPRTSTPDCSSKVDETPQSSAEEEEEAALTTTTSSSSRAQQPRQGPFLQTGQTVEILQQRNTQNVAEAHGHGVYGCRLDDFSRKGQAPPAASSSVTGSCTDNIICLQLWDQLDPLDQFLMLRKAPPPPAVSKGPAVVTAATVDSQAHRGVGGGPSSSSLVAIVQPCVNAAAAIEPLSSNHPMQVQTVIEVSSSSTLSSVYPSSSSSCLEAESNDIVYLSASTVINIPLNAPPFECLLRLIEETAHPFLVLLKRYRIIVGERNMNLLQSNVMSFIVKQQQNNDFSSALLNDVDVQLKMDLLRAAICVHCLVSAREHLIHSSLSSATHVLSMMKARNQQIIGGLLDNIQQKLLLEQSHHSKDGILHPKALEMCHLICQFQSTYSRTDSKSKVLVILPACGNGQDESHMSLGHYLLEIILTSFEEIRPTLFSSFLLPTDLDRCDAYNCYLVASNHLTEDSPWTDFDLVIEYSSSLASTYREKCLLVKVPFVGLQGDNENLHLTLDGDENDDEVVIWRSCLQQISIVMSRDVTAKHEELIHLLETRYNVVVTDRDYARLMISGYFEDMTVGGNTVIIIEDLMVLQRKQEMERLVMRVSGLKQKSLACWILLLTFSTNVNLRRLTPPDHSSDLYSGNVIINISKLQASFGVLAKPDFQIKIIFCHSYNSMAMRIRQIASDALSRRDSSSSGQTKVDSSIEPTQDESFLLSVPSLNSISAQMFLRIGSLKTLLTISKSELLERSSSSMPIKIMQTFLEFRESVGEIFLILKHAQCREYGQNLLQNDSPENRCHWSPHGAAAAATCSGWSMLTEGGMDRRKEEEEEDLRNNNDPLKTYCLSSSKLNDFQKAKMCEKSFAAILASLKSHLSSDEMMLETEDEKEKFTVRFDYDDRNPAHYAQSVETEGQLDFSFTGSGKSVRNPLMSRNESNKWRYGDHALHWDGSLSLSATAATATPANDKVFKMYNEEDLPTTTMTCYSVNSIGSSTTSDITHLKTISKKSATNNSSSTDNFPLGRHKFTLSDEEVDRIDNDCGNADVDAEDGFFSNDQEIGFFQPFQHLQRTTTIRNDGLTTVTTGCHSQCGMELGNTPITNDGIDVTYGRGNDRETDYVDRRRFRQPVLSLTLDDNNFLDQKSNRNLRSHARGSEHSFGCRWPSQVQSSFPASHASSLKKRKLTFERDDAAKSGQTKLKFI